MPLNKETETNYNIYATYHQHNRNYYYNLTQISFLHKIPILYNNVMNRVIGLGGRVFANDPGDRGSIPGRLIPKT